MAYPNSIPYLDHKHNCCKSTKSGQYNHTHTIHDTHEAKIKAKMATHKQVKTYSNKKYANRSSIIYAKDRKMKAKAAAFEQVHTGYTPDEQSNKHAEREVAVNPGTILEDFEYEEESNRSPLTPYY
jgi:hypothetical protein